MIGRFLSALGYEKRSADLNPAFAPDVWGRAPMLNAFASSGAVLSNLAVATRCVSLRSELLASVPLKLYRRLPNGERERVSDNPLADVLADLANPLQTAFEARELFTRSLDTAGNSYSRIERDGAGQVVALWPLEASRVTVERLENGRLRYRYSADRGPVVLLQEEVLHIRASSEDGLLGRSPIAIARGALGFALSLNRAAADVSESGLKIAGVLTHPGKLSESARQNISRSFEGQPNKAGGVKVLEEGSRFVPTAFTAADAELLESRKLSNEDVARIFGVPPASVGISQSVSYGSAQQAAQDLVTNALAPLATRIEQAMQRCLLTPEGRRIYIIEHDLSGLLRADSVARWQSHKTAREIGVISAREIRRIENLGPMDPDDDYTPVRATADRNDPIATVKP